MVLLLVALALGTGTGVVLSWGIVDQANSLAERLPEIAERLRAQLATVLERFPWILERLRVRFRAQLIDMAIIGAITTVGLLLVGVNYWALFGLLTAIFGIIPYVGVMLVVILVSLVTLASDPGQLPWVLLVFFITQQIEGNIVLPMVMKGQAEIPEAVLIVVMLFFGSWFGPSRFPACRLRRFPCSFSQRIGGDGSRVTRSVWPRADRRARRGELGQSSRPGLPRKGGARSQTALPDRRARHRTGTSSAAAR